MIKKIFVFGDSIVQGSNDWTGGGWVVRLKNYFSQTGQFHHIFNLGISGENSSHIISRMEVEIKPRKSEDRNKKSLLIVGIPINDTRIKDKLDGDPEISIARFKANLEELYSIGKKNSNELVFLGMTKVDEEKTNPWQEVVDRRIVCWRNDVIEKYNDIIKKYCDEKNIYFINMIDLLKNSDLSDGLHPNEVGHNKMYERIRDFLIEKKLIKKLNS